MAELKVKATERTTQEGMYALFILASGCESGAYALQLLMGLCLDLNAS